MCTVFAYRELSMETECLEYKRNVMKWQY